MRCGHSLFRIHIRKILFIFLYIVSARGVKARFAENAKIPLIILQMNDDAIYKVDLLNN